MIESRTRAAGFFTYAAFGASGGRPAGWRVGQCEGMSHEDAEHLSNQVPSYLATETPVPRYAGEKELKELIHRGVWRSNPLNSSENLFIHSTPAGTDASGRPSNVFTTVYVFDAGKDLGMHPAQMLGSASLLVPFNKEVNNRRVESFEIVANPSTTPRVAFDRLMSATRRSFTHIRDIVATVLDSLYNGGRVIIGDDTDNAWAWVALVNFAMDRVSAARYGFSTYEREYTIGTEAAPGNGVYVMPREDLPKVTAAISMIDAIDVIRGVSRGELNGATSVGDDADKDIPVTPLSVLFSGVVSSPQAADVLLEEPVRGGAPADKLVALVQRSADGSDDKVRLALAALHGQAEAQRAQPAPGAPVAGGTTTLPSGTRETPGEPAPENPFSAPAEPGNPYDQASASPAAQQQPAPPQARPGRTVAEVRKISTERITRINNQLDKQGTGIVWTGEDHRGWPDFIEVLLAVSAPGGDLWNVQARLFATAAASLIQRPEAALEVDWLPWWKLGDSAELRATVLEQLRAYRQILSKGAAEQIGNLAGEVDSFELRGLLEKFQSEVEQGLRSARNPYVGLRGGKPSEDRIRTEPIDPRTTDRVTGRYRLDKE